SVMSSAAVSRSTMPSLAASMCSRAAGSMVMEGLEAAVVVVVVVAEAALLAVLLLLAAFGPRRRPSATKGMPPSFACTVRSWRNSRSRRTKVLRHFRHLKGRSLVSGRV
ncbi:hypothetical protein LOZ39_006900, partial [Ophidiomyces ophidiicola]